MLFVGIAAGIFGLDFFLKRYIEKRYARKVRHPKLGKLIYIEKYYNKGAMLNALEKRPGLLKGLHTILMFFVCAWFYFVMRRDGGSMQKTGLAFLIGGGMNNLFDRYTKGHVVDYVEFGFGPKWFRRIVFNVSDFFIFLGAVFVALGER